MRLYAVASKVAARRRIRVLARVVPIARQSEPCQEADNRVGLWSAETGCWIPTLGRAEPLNGDGVVVGIRQNHRVISAGYIVEYCSVGLVGAG